MADITSPLILDLIEWVAAEPRTYAETMQAWRTSCPRLTIWEDAVDAGFVACAHRPGAAPFVTATAAGHAQLLAAGRAVPAPVPAGNGRRSG